MTTDTLSSQVRRSIDAITDEGAASPIEVLFVGEGAVWLVADPDSIDSDEAMIDLFRTLEAIPGVETLYVERADTIGADPGQPS
ncbi:hypothetical protein Hrd1104_12105 [Halorhabdus sp. CBA1104]|uniref:hypothetical protein n=1 Tax=unclassified Halorhabdus TaxID=2621901 RepID=UPI0012B24857|nr:MULTISPECIES: hypothetical protein [unclassified Halorhabdus]QGN07963.1 hypothetical protein Hrd1104_12105 [Halorhabdus sp. CBA1104]